MDNVYPPVLANRSKYKGKTAAFSQRMYRAPLVFLRVIELILGEGTIGRIAIALTLKLTSAANCARGDLAIDWRVFRMRAPGHLRDDGGVTLTIRTYLFAVDRFGFDLKVFTFGHRSFLS